jgi:hypothetical protein
MPSGLFSCRFCSVKKKSKSSLLVNNSAEYKTDYILDGNKTVQSVKIYLCRVFMLIKRNLGVDGKF